MSHPLNNITPLLAFQDNYIWAMHSPDKRSIVVVDPGDAQVVLSYLHSHQLSLSAILATHHHWDHTGGIAELCQQFPDIPVYSAKNVKEGDEVFLPSLSLTFKVLEIPGHTLDHIAFVAPEILFCGDTLFSCGAGRIFEGTPAQMLHALDKIKALPKNTQIYCGHEYTLANIAFAKVVDPTNQALIAREKAVIALRKAHKPSLPVSLEIELQTNPFLRCTNQAIISAVENHYHCHLGSEVEVFAHLREWKNQFTA